MFSIFRCGNVNWLQIIRNGNIQSMESANRKLDSLLALFLSLARSLFFGCSKIYTQMELNVRTLFHVFISSLCVSVCFYYFPLFLSPMSTKCSVVYALNAKLHYGSHFDLEYVSFAVWCVTVSASTTIACNNNTKKERTTATASTTTKNHVCAIRIARPKPTRNVLYEHDCSRKIGEKSTTACSAVANTLSHIITECFLWQGAYGNCIYYAVLLLPFIELSKNIKNSSRNAFFCRNNANQIISMAFSPSLLLSLFPYIGFLFVST